MPSKIKIIKAKPSDAFALSVLTRKYFDYAQLNHEKILKRLNSPNYEYWVARDAASGALAGFIDIDFAPVRGLRKNDAFEKDSAAVTEQKEASGVAYTTKARRAMEREGTRAANHRSPRSKQAKILGLAVLPEFRGRGIARRLIAKAEARAKARGCRNVFLLVREDNALARALYEKLGFSLRGTLAEKLWGKTILLYSKELE
ncbi:MAG: GNAT family N-acetyltransferase [Candidatus Norongarragalinales archaeon]